MKIKLLNKAPLYIGLNLNSLREFYTSLFSDSAENIPISGSVLTEEPGVFTSKCIRLNSVYFLKDFFLLSTALNSYVKAQKTTSQ